MPETLNDSKQTRPEANQLAIYKHGRGFEPGTSEFQVQRSNRSVTLPANYILRGVLFLLFIILPHTMNYNRNKNIINRLINIKFKICTLLGRSDCGEEISENPSLVLNLPYFHS